MELDSDRHTPNEYPQLPGARPHPPVTCLWVVTFSLGLLVPQLPQTAGNRTKFGHPSLPIISHYGFMTSENRDVGFVCAQVASPTDHNTMSQNIFYLLLQLLTLICLVLFKPGTPRATPNPVNTQAAPLACSQGPGNCLCHHLPWSGVLGVCCR